MGILTKSSALGVVTGKVGDIQLSRRFDKIVVRSLPEFKRRRKFSDVQKAQHALFKLVGNFLSFPGHKIFERGYQFPKKKTMTGQNAATRYHVLNAIVGTYPECSFDLSMVKFTMPLRPTENGWNAQFAVAEEGAMEVSWELNSFPEISTRLDDEPIIVFYDDTFGSFYVRSATQRRSLSYHFKHAKYKISHDFHCWLFFLSANGKLVSETKYLGMLKTA